MKTLPTLLIAGTLCLGAARAEVETVQVGEDRAEKLVATLTAFDKQKNNVAVIVARGDTKIEISNVQTVRSEGRLLMIDYAAAADSKTYRAAVDAADVLLIVERPK